MTMTQKEFFSYMPEELLELGAAVYRGEGENMVDVPQKEIDDFVFEVCCKAYGKKIEMLIHEGYCIEEIKEAIMEDHKATSVKPREHKHRITLCSAEGCDSLAKYQIKEKFQDPHDSQKTLFTQAWCWCDEHNHMDAICQETNKSVKEI